MPQSLSALVARGLRTHPPRLPVLPHVAAQILTMADDPRADARWLAGLINRDATLAAHSLRIANSAGFAGASPARTLKEAVTRVGLRLIGHLAVAATVKETLYMSSGADDRYFDLWARSLARALWSVEISHLLRQRDAGAFLCGLLQQVGRPVALLQVTRCAKELDARPSDVEFDIVLEEAQVAVGHRIAVQWKLPPDVHSCILHPHGTDGSPPYAAAVHRTAFADLLARRMAGSGGDGTEDVQVFTSRLQISPRALEDLLSRQETIERSVMGSVI